MDCTLHVKVAAQAHQLALLVHQLQQPNTIPYMFLAVNMHAYHLCWLAGWLQVLHIGQCHVHFADSPF
jgi:hypothetical protein